MFQYLSLASALAVALAIIGALTFLAVNGTISGVAVVAMFSTIFGAFGVGAGLHVGVTAVTNAAAAQNNPKAKP